MSVKTKNKALWITQAIVAIMFVLAALSKLLADPVQLAAQSNGLSVGFLQFIGACELLGAIGLIIPSVTGIMPWLTRVAAGGLLVIMVGAIVTTLQVPDQPKVLALIPLVVAILLVVVVVGRGKIPPGSR